MNTYNHLFDRLNGDWRQHVEEYISSASAVDLIKNLNAEIASGLTIFPKQDQIFNAFAYTPWLQVKVVIIGQDPYHNIGQAEGLAFSVPTGQKLPPSLRNIFKELYSDLGIPVPQSGSLKKWADEGVLLLNTSLTVRAHQPLSHKGIGWEEFTKYIIKIISEEKENIVFILWGRQAGEYAKLIHTDKHLILTSAHPSPLSAHNGFWQSKPFSKTNAFLKSKGITPINWQLEETLF